MRISDWSSDVCSSDLPYLLPPDPLDHLIAYQAFSDAGVPVFAITIAGATHFDFSLLPTFPATSWCPQLVDGACSGRWGLPLTAQIGRASCRDRVCQDV